MSLGRLDRARLTSELEPEAEGRKSSPEGGTVLAGTSVVPGLLRKDIKS